MRPSAYTNCPPSSALHTGDLLFPRQSKNNLENTGDTSQTDTTPLDTDRMESGKNELNLDNWQVKSLLFKIMSFEMKDLFKEWLDMSVMGVMNSQLGELFLELLKSNTPRQDNFLAGHMSMVIREEAGQVVTNGSTSGTVYVIEANITDYCHYRVAVHPYWVDESGSPTLGELRGWANRRIALGEKVWSARPVALAANNGSETLGGALVEHAKRWLGRPYGFFDHPTFGNPDRMYCAEYLYNVFKDASTSTQPAASVELDDKRTWGWMLRYFAASKQDRLHGLLKALMEQKHIPPGKPFFVLTPAMVWSSDTMTQHSSPLGEGPYCVEV